MYLGVEVDGQHHLWRQRFPAGKPEQITFGLTEEDGVAVAPDGRSLITSIGTRQGSLWIHDDSGDRPLTTEGYVPYMEQTPVSGSVPLFSRDGRSLFYMRSEAPGIPAELWRADLGSEKSDKVFPGIPMVEYDISDDGKAIVYSTQPAGKPGQIWLAPMDRSSPSQLVSADGRDSPRFGPDGQIVYRVWDGVNHYLEKMGRDGSGRTRVAQYPVGLLYFMSPDRRWILNVATMNGVGGTFAVPMDGGPPRRICSGCPVLWDADGRFMYVSVARSRKAKAIPLRNGEMIPPLPPTGRAEDPTIFPEARLIDEFFISPGRDPSVYAYVKTAVHRNLFRIPLRSE
jgi:hypothetical protein